MVLAKGSVGWFLFGIALVLSGLVLSGVFAGTFSTAFVVKYFFLLPFSFTHTHTFGSLLYTPQEKLVLLAMDVSHVMVGEGIPIDSTGFLQTL